MMPRGGLNLRLSDWQRMCTSFHAFFSPVGWHACELSVTLWSTPFLEGGGFCLQPRAVYRAEICPSTSICTIPFSGGLPSLDSTRRGDRILDDIPCVVPLIPICFCLGTRDNIDCFHFFFPD